MAWVGAIVLGIVVVHATTVPWFARFLARHVSDVGAWLVPPAAAAASERVASAESQPGCGDRAADVANDATDDADDMTDVARKAAAPIGKGALSRRDNPAAARVCKTGPGSRAATGHSIYVTRQTVEGFLKARVNPSGRSVAATAEHPAGVEITNPDGLRRLARAGDIIVDIEGRPTPTIEDLIAAVGAAQQQHASRVSGHVLRNGERWSVTVEPPW